MSRWATLAAACCLLVVLGVDGCRPRSTNAADAGVACTIAGCAADEYCAFTPGLCGKGKRPGACRARPTACTSAYVPVCGCDGHVYRSECDAHAAGVDLDVNGRCREHAAADWAPCGARFCDARVAYCEIVLSDVFELPTDFTCKPLPASCLVDRAARSCDCFPKETRCLSFCGPMETGGASTFHLTCRL